MGLVRKFRAIIGPDLAGEPSDGQSASWHLRNAAKEVGGGACNLDGCCCAKQKSARLIELPYEALLVVLYQEFHNSDFSWFDMLYRGIPASLQGFRDARNY
jgi:hypothetical protein